MALVVSSFAILGAACGNVATAPTRGVAVGGTVSGLAGTGLVLQNNGSDDLAVSANSSFAFATALQSGAAYDVTISTQPSDPSQTCTVGGGSGTAGSADVASVTINCERNTYMLGGTVTGLAGTLVLENSNGDRATVTANGTFAFPTTLVSGTPYRVTVAGRPDSPAQYCTIAAGTGTVADADVTSVAVTCGTDEQPVTGRLIGLPSGNTIVIADGSDELTLGASGGFAFPTPVTSGSTYDVRVVTQPASQPVARPCFVEGGSGTAADTAIDGVEVVCGERLLLVAADDYTANVQTTLVATSQFATVDVFDASAGTPTLPQLQEYDAALVWSDDGFADPTGLGDVLADYFDGGGKVVIAVFANAGISVTGRWSTGNYQLIDPISQTEPSSTTPITILDNTSPLVANVSTLTATSAYQSTGGVINGGVAVADWGTGGVLIVRGVKNSRNYAALNMFPPSSVARSDFWVGDGATIMANALYY